MIPTRRLAAVAVLGALSVACNPQRQQQCDRLLAAMKPFDDGVPVADAVDRVHRDIAALSLEDQPLRIYAENYGRTLTVLASTLALQAGPSPPDGTDDVIKSRLREARTDRQDVERYCAQ